MMAKRMSLLNRVWPALALAMSPGAHADSRVDCPRAHSDGETVQELVTADVFRGPPEKRASLLPDGEQAEWYLPPYQENALKRGEALYLICRYNQLLAPVVIEIPRDADRCKVEETRDGTVAFCLKTPASVRTSP